jgi:hypothetical protein
VTTEEGFLLVVQRVDMLLQITFPDGFIAVFTLDDPEKMI